MSNAPSSFEEILQNITPEIHQNLKTAIELGRWENGERLSAEQVDLCLQAVIAYDEKNLNAKDRVAYIDRTKLKKQKCDD